MIHVTQGQLARIFPNARKDILDAVAAQADDVLPRFDIDDTPTRIVYFFAQIGHETGGLMRLEESFYYKTAERIFKFYRTKGRFDSVSDAEPFVRNPEGLKRRLYGDGPSYYGRGLIQLTNRGNYEAVGKIVDLPLVDDPDLAADTRHALLIAAGYWHMRGINESADRNDFDGASRRINPEEPDLSMRRTYLAVAKRVLGVSELELPQALTDIENAVGDFAMIALGAQGAQVESVQRTLEALKYPVGKTDGKFGRLTRAALAAFQLDNDLPATGVVDQDTWNALSTATPRPLEAARTDVDADEVRKAGSRTIANADNVGRSGLAAAVVGALGILVNGLPSANGVAGGAAAAATPTATATTDLAQRTQDLLAMLKATGSPTVDFAQRFGTEGPKLLQALNDWVAAVAPGASAGGAGGALHAGATGLGNSQLPGPLSELGQLLLPIASSIVPGGLTGSALLAALGIGMRIFSSRIIDARVSDYASGKNLGR